MSWVRIHDGALRHPKVSRLSDLAFRLWVAGLAYCQEQLTDGVLARGQLQALSVRAPRRAVDELVSGRLWDATDTGFQVHDYLVWNDSREEILRKRADAKDRLDRHRLQRVSNTVAVKDVTHSTLAGARSGVSVSVGSGGVGSEGEAGKPAIPAPLIRGGSHRSHASCGRPCVPATLHEEFVRKRGGDPDEADRVLRAWYTRVQDHWAGKELPADDFEFWRAAHRAEWPMPRAAVNSRDALNRAAGQSALEKLRARS